MNLYKWLSAGLMVVTLFSWPGLATEPAGVATANTCVSCHAGLDDEEMSEPVGLWRRSAHNPAGIACQDCHGGNPNATTEAEAHDIAAGYVGEPPPETLHEVCGACHQLQKDNYVPSPHGLEGSFWPSCVDCHSNHEVKHPVVAEIAVPDLCEDCHEQETLDQFIAVVDRGLKPLNRFRTAAGELTPTGVPVDQILAMASMANDAFDQKASHVFNLAVITATVDSLEKDYGRIQKEVEAAREEVSVRRRFGWLLTGVLVLMAGLIWLYRRSIPDA
jgi:predicted CXXCH cytochrome family protein